MMKDKGSVDTLDMEDQQMEGVRTAAQHAEAMQEASDFADAKVASNGNKNEGKNNNSSTNATNDTQQNRSGSGENDSSSSSNGLGSGSGSGGYNGDCSSSDASSDTSSKRKNASPDLAMEKMTLNGEEKQVDGDGVKQTDSTAVHAKKKKKKKKRSSEESEAQQQPNNNHQVQSTDANYDIASIASSSGKSASHDQLGALDAILEQSRRLKDAKQISALPQWQGVRVTHPMDPRIDLSTVGHVPGSSVPLALNATQDPNVAPPSLDNYLQMMEAVRPFFMAYGIAPPGPMPTPMMPTVEAEKVASDNVNTGSSEGFTAFFTTTEKSGSSDSNSNLKNSSDSNSNQNSNQENNDKGQAEAAKRRRHHHHDDAVHSPESNAPVGEVPERLLHADSLPSQQQQSAQGSSQDDSDTSSMIVLARVKRKHQRKQQAGEGDSKGSSTGQQDASNAASPVGDAENDAESQADADAEAAANININPIAAQPLKQEEQRQPNESSSSSSSSEQPIHMQPQAIEDRQQQAMENLQQQQGLQDVGNGQPRIVSEVSSSNTGTNTSGSGSGGNSGSNSANSGGSNQNSSGSGGENPGSSGNSGGEGKGSSEDIAKDDNSGGDTNSNSNEMVVDATEATVPDPRKLPSSAAFDEQSLDDDASREKKLIDKKRKRMNMRREYEEQVQQELGSDSSQDEVVLRPGNPVTLDAVLSFTKNARVVVQATPPFLVVHANAAYSALTGIDSHFIIGKPIRTVLSVPESKEQQYTLPEINNADGSRSGQSSMTNSATVNQQNQLQATAGAPNQQAQPSQEQQAASTNNDRTHATAAAVGQARAQSNEMIEMSVERLVAASGFGCIHVMNVMAKPHIMVGRNVTVVREKNLTGDQQSRRDGEQRSQTSSLPSTDGAFHAFSCHMSVSPVVSSPSAIDYPPPQVVTDQEKSSRRRKHNDYHQHHYYRRHAKNNLVSHYVIQLEKVATVARAAEQSQESLSSASKVNSLDSRKLPAANEQEAPRDAVVNAQQPMEEDEVSETTDPKEPVAAVG